MKLRGHVFCVLFIDHCDVAPLCSICSPHNRLCVLPVSSLPVPFLFLSLPGRRRARGSERQSHSKLTITELFRLFFVLPITHLFLYFSDPSVRPSDKSILAIDVISVILVFCIGFLVADVVVLHPASLEGWLDLSGSGGGSRAP